MGDKDMVVAHDMYAYMVPSEAAGQPPVMMTARYGETVKVSAAEADRGLSTGGLVEPGEGAPEFAVPTGDLVALEAEARAAALSADTDRIISAATPGDAVKGAKRTGQPKGATDPASDPAVLPDALA